MPDSGLSRVGTLPWGSHICQFHDTDQELVEVLVPFFEAGLRQRERCLWVTGRLDFARAVVHDHWAGRENEVVVIPDFEHYELDHSFNIEQACRRWAHECDLSRQQGFAGTRALDEKTWLNKVDWAQVSGFVESLSRLLEDRQMLLMCSYCGSDLTAAQVLDVAHAHQGILVRKGGEWQIVETPVEAGVRERTDKLMEANRELRRLSNRLQSAREEEGARIARELHDELGAALTSLKWDLEALERHHPEAGDRIRWMSRQVDGAVERVRRLASELRPPLLDDLGLPEALEWQTQQFQQRTGIPCRLDNLIDDSPVEKTRATALFRICQEALTNVMRHAKASQVTVTLAQEGNEWVMEVRDNGVGLPAHLGRTLGLLGIRERARLLGGEARIERLEKGTVLEARIPC